MPGQAQVAGPPWEDAVPPAQRAPWGRLPGTTSSGALHTYTIGFAALEASQARPAPGIGEVSSLAQQLAAYTTAEQFMNGLRYLLEGIGRHVTTDTEPGR